MKKNTDLTQGKILGPLMRFTLPIMAALILQTLYGAVDLLVVGQFASPASVSAVATGSQVLYSLTVIITGLAMGVTIIIGQQFGQRREHEIGNTVGAGICLFATLSLTLTAVMMFMTPVFVRLLHAPPEAFEYTVQYVMICSAGILFIAAYNTLGSIFRGMGDARTPLIAVMIACAANILLDLLFVAAFRLGASGAALATVFSQAISVVLSLIIIKKRGLAFPFSRKQIRFDRKIILRIVKMGAPCALQDLLVSISFLAITAIVNQLGVIASAGVGVAEKLCGFIMLVPSAYTQSMSAYVAQNIGAGQPKRAIKGLYYGMLTSFCFGIIMSYFAFFHGDLLSRVFAKDSAVILASAEYLKGYAIDTLLVSFLFCFIGYFNGCGCTTFVMIQGLIGAFGVRIPVSYLMSRAADASLFHIALATPCSTVIQIVLCFWFFKWGYPYFQKKQGMGQEIIR